LSDQIGVSESWIPRENARRLADAAQGLNPEMLDRARERGRTMTMDQGVAFALEQLDQDGD
jgi:hypothetical protein